MFHIDLSKYLTKGNFIIFILGCVLTIGIYLVHQTTNHLPTQIKDLKEEMKEEIKDLKEGMKEEIKDLKEGNNGKPKRNKQTL